MTTIDFKEFRKRVGDTRGREYWRSLEELDRSGEFDAFFAQEFPQQALPLERGVDRRSFMKLMGASVALGGLAACQGPAEKIVPYVNQPENLIPGKPIFFASAMTLNGAAAGVLVESHMGRPTKIEGNPDHPSSLGATDAFMQASILNLYDPDRSQVVRHLGEISTWSDFLASLQPILKMAASQPGAVRILTQTISSPTMGDQIQQLMAKYPGIAWHQWEPVNRSNQREGLRAAFGGYVNAVYHFDKANVVVALDSDFMEHGPGHLRYARDFADRRRVRKGQTKSINRLYAIESSPGGSGAIADHRYPVRSSEIESWARAILDALGGGQTQSPAIAGIAKDLQANRGASIVIAGDDQPPVVHAIAMAINQALGNVGATITITDPVEVMPVNELESLRKLVTDMNSGAVKALIMMGGNPAFDAPADFNFAQALVKVPFRVHQSLYYDETGMLCHWHIPDTHFLESWSDARGHDGTVSIVQPLIAPLYNGRSQHEMLGALLGGMDVSPYDAVRGYWMTKAGGPTFEATWRKWLNDGVIANSALPARAGSAAATAIPAEVAKKAASGYELQLRPDATIYDGRFANNGWLQELPKPQTKVTWDNVLLISPKTARDLGYDDDRRDALVNERTTLRANLTYRGRTQPVPLWVIPGHPDGCATLSFGYGRERGGSTAAGKGVNAYTWRFSDAMSGGAGAQIALTRDVYPIACTQEHQSLNVDSPDMEGVAGDRGIIRSASFDEYQRNPNFAHEGKEGKPESMYPQYKYENHAWAMVIDTSVCTGCNGCVVACVAENNIAIVGKEEVVREREMHWLRIDRYYKGAPENPQVYHQPVPCMQCEQAPCEPVCPVMATSHSTDGLNDMTYNRCVGTRYCSNNCPYKVRRFNFFHYSDRAGYYEPALKPMHNPDVTVRSRGVMEKCTYCVQRLNAAKIEAEKRGGDQRVKDGEVTTACAQACPTRAITFGDMNDPNSEVRKLKGEPTNYTLLEELNTRPRTTYLATIRNPNPEIKG